VAVRDFDRKFGAQFLDSVPGLPGVYLVYNDKEELIYVGKAKHLKRRLSQYRNSTRRKKHRRMRGIVKDAARIEIRSADTHLAACLEETVLIQKHRPHWNIVGAYSFLYPLIGIRSVNANIEFCLTTTPDAVLERYPGFEFHGAFRSRRITWRRVLRVDAPLQVRRARESSQTTNQCSQIQLTCSASENCRLTWASELGFLL
jgi:excinuclease ABC subunit C